jgi:hypothetical protein
LIFHGCTDSHSKGFIVISCNYAALAAARREPKPIGKIVYYIYIYLKFT